MGKTVFMLSVSLDGFMEGLDADISWHRVDDEVHEFFNREIAGAGAFLSGRLTHQLMDDYWPTADQEPDAPPAVVEFAAIWRDTPKYVFSRTLTTFRDATVVDDVRPDDIRAMRERLDGPLFVGGPGLASTFLRHGLIDEIRVSVHPVLVGRGRRMFVDPGATPEIDLIDTHRFGNGVVHLRYAVRP